jgi:hypothetical protein
MAKEPDSNPFAPTKVLPRDAAHDTLEPQVDEHPAEPQTEEQSAELQIAKTIPQIETNKNDYAEASIPEYIITTVKQIKESLQRLNVRGIKKRIYQNQDR